MPLTFQQAQTALSPRTPAGKTADYINRAVERLLVMGGVKGLTEKVTFTVYADVHDTVPAETLQLPAKYSAILGAIIRGTQTGVAAEWYAFMPGAPVDTAGLPTHPISDLGLDPTTGLHLYHVPMIDGDTSVTVTARCRRQHVELANNSDLVPITNLSALGLAVDAIGQEMAGDFDQSSKYFERAVALLREERKEMEPDFPACSPIRVLNLGVDATGPTSFY